MANKITKKDNFMEIRGIVEGMNRPDLVDFINHEIELIASKSGKKSAKVVAEQSALDTEVTKALNEVGATVTEVYSRMGKPDGLSTPKLTASLKRLMADGVATNYKDGKSSLYRLAD